MPLNPIYASGVLNHTKEKAANAVSVSYLLNYIVIQISNIDVILPLLFKCKIYNFKSKLIINCDNNV